MSIKALLFDLDGTVLDTSEDLQSALHRVQSHYETPLSSLKDVQAAMGHGIEALVKQCLTKLNPSDLDEAFRLFHEAYAQCYNQKTAPYPKIKDYLTQLHHQGLHLAVVTNKADSYAQNLIKTHFPDLFECVMGASSQYPKKPHPAMIEESLKRLGVEAHEALYIGDTEVDLLSAQNARMKGILVAWGYRSYESLIDLKSEAVYRTVDDCFRALGCV